MSADDSEDEQEVQWLLGFLDEPERQGSLLRHRFPSKIYAAPPEGSEEDHEGAFHRAIFVFVSPDGRRLADPGAVAALRCQLPRRNPYYAPEPAPEDQLLPEALGGDDRAAALAADPWEVALAERDLKGAHGPGGAPPLFREQEIIIEREQDAVGSEGSEDGEENAAANQEQRDEGQQGATTASSSNLTAAALRERVRQYRQRVAEEGELPDDEVEQVDEAFRDQLSLDDRMWTHFQAVTSAAPENVLRYCVDAGAQPLWGRAAPMPGAIPPCGVCGAPRRFEFQVLPQMLSFLGVDDSADDALDWLTIAIYTCSKSCLPPRDSAGGAHQSAYVDEFVFVQPPLAEQAVTQSTKLPKPPSASQPALSSLPE